MKKSFQIKISNETVTSSKYEKLLGQISINMSHWCARKLARN